MVRRPPSRERAGTRLWAVVVATERRPAGCAVVRTPLRRRSAAESISGDIATGAAGERVGAAFAFRLDARDCWSCLLARRERLNRLVRVPLAPSTWACPWCPRGVQSSRRPPTATASALQNVAKACGNAPQASPPQRSRRSTRAHSINLLGAARGVQLHACALVVNASRTAHAMPLLAQRPAREAQSLALAAQLSGVLLVGVDVAVLLPLLQPHLPPRVPASAPRRAA